MLLKGKRKRYETFLGLSRKCNLRKVPRGKGAGIRGGGF
jgi:hypothetical protein